MINKNDILSFTFQEQFNYDKLYKLINNFDEIIDQLPIERQNKIKEKAKEFDPLIALKKILKVISKQDSINTVKYAFSKSSKNYGRLFAKNASYQGLTREFRALLAEEFYYDIDFVNCHPNILEQYCKKKGISCNVLTNYNLNKDNIIIDIQQKYDINKQDIKDIFLTLINGGDRIGVTLIDEYLQSFKNEMKTIHNLIVQLNPNILKQIKKIWGNNQHNIYGKVVNCILCQIENEIMLTAVEYLLNNGYNIDCLIFDGFLIRKNKTITSELLDMTSQYVYSNTGYNLKLIHKEFNNIISLDNFNSIEEDELIKLKKDETYPQDKEEFEKNHFKIMCPPSYATLYDDKELYIQSTEHFKQTYSHKLTKKIIPMLGKQVLATDAFTYYWYKDPSIRIYRKADFYPNIKLCPPDVYNLFNGFKADEYEPINNNEVINELVEPIIEHLKVVAQDNYEFLIKYYAYIIQYPELKTNINIVIAGKDGTGKSIINDFFRDKILGHELSAQTDDTDELFGKFSNIYVKKLFLQIDEISKEDFNKKKLEKLKNITTCKTIKYEKKGFDPITINNYLNTIMTTNNDFTIPISQTDRRNVFFKCDDTYLGNYDYWNKLSSHLKKNEVARAFYEYLINYDLSSIFISNNIESGLQFIRPQTKYNDEIKSLCLAYNYRFLSALVHSIYVDDITNNGIVEYSASKLYKDYLEWFDKSKWSSKPSSVKKFFMDIKNIDGIYKKRFNNRIEYTINRNELYEYLNSNKLYDEDAFFH